MEHAVPYGPSAGSDQLHPMGEQRRAFAPISRFGPHLFVQPRAQFAFLFQRRPCPGQESAHFHPICDCLQQVVHFQDRQGFALSGLRKVQSRAAKERPIGAHREDCLMFSITQQPRGTCLANSGGKAGGNRWSWMRLVFRFKSPLEMREKLVGRLAVHSLKEQGLR